MPEFTAKHFRRILLGVFVFTHTFLIASSGVSQTVESDLSIFDGKTINYVVGSKPGGGYDRTARLIAPFLEKQLEGSVVVVLNRGKSGGLGSLNKLAVASGDGSTIMTLNTGYLMSQIGAMQALKADLRTLKWIGKATSEARYIVVTPESGVKSIADLRNQDRQVIFASGAFGSAAYIQSALLRDIFDLNLKILTGFGGSESRAAMAKNEIHGSVTSESNVAKLVKSGTGIPIVRFGKAMNPAFSDVPDATDIATTPEQLLVARQIEILANLGRLTAASPATSEPILTSLRQAYINALSDPQLLEEAARQDIVINYLEGDEVERLIAEFLDADPKFRAFVEATVKR